MHPPHYPQHYDDLQKGVMDVAAALGRASAEFAVQQYYRFMVNRPVTVEVTPAREHVESVRNVLHAGASPNQVWDGVMDYTKNAQLNPQQQQICEKYAGMILRNAELKHAMDVAKPVATLSKSPRQTL